MDRIRTILCGMLPAMMFGALLPAVAPAQSNDFKVIPAAVNESRYNVLIPTKRKNYYGNSLTVTLRFEGEGVAKSTRYGAVKVTSAKDNNGADVKMSRSFGYASKNLRPMNRNTIGVAGEKLPISQIEIPMRFELPSRSATSLALIKGTATFAVGKTETVTIPVSQLQDLIGKNIENPLLSKLGLTVNVEKYTKTRGQSARLKITGDKRDAVLSANFVDPAGKSKNVSSYVFRSFSYTSANANSSKPLPEGSTLQLVVETESKEVVVPFEVTDIELK